LLLKKYHQSKKRLSFFFFLAILLSGCSNAEFIVLDPKGPVGELQANLIIISVIILSVVIIPVLLFFVYVVFRYRDKPENKAPFQPEWDDSKTLEIIWWGIPIILVAILSVYTVRDTIALTKPPSDDNEPMTIQVTSLDWKWLFQYPEEGIATVNYLHIPTNTPVRFELTTDAPINSFWIPELGGQKYTIPGKALTLWLEADEEGTYDGKANNFSGVGFTDMKFDVVATSAEDYDKWVQDVKQSDNPLTKEKYTALAEPNTVGTSEYSSIPKDLFQYIIDKNGGQYYRSNEEEAMHLDQTSPEVKGE
jgi:cytochrome aa3-600 menaquinol oxidase subunit 2